jgi:hypothetical protein
MYWYKRNPPAGALSSAGGGNPEATALDLPGPETAVLGCYALLHPYKSAIQNRLPMETLSWRFTAPGGPGPLPRCARRRGPRG